MAASNFDVFSIIWWTYNFKSRISCSSIHLRNILISKVTYILGISAFYHDSAACLIKDGEIIAAAQEERFTRIKHDESYPFHSIKFILDYTGLKLKDIDKIVFYEKPFLKFERLLETYLSVAPRGFKSFSKAMPVWLNEKLFQKYNLIKSLKTNDKSFNNVKNIHFAEHHMSHAASAFYPSPFEEAIILTADGVGEWATTTIAHGIGNHVEILEEIHFPHSLGLLYSAFTYYTGFKVNGGEYKLMGLAPYGQPIYEDKILEYLIDIKDDGSFYLNQDYFDYATGLTMTNKKFDELFGFPRRDPQKIELNKFYMDVAASIQTVTEKIMLNLTKNIRKKYNVKNLCLAGGVALNCVANGKILEEKIFDNIWVQPAAGDAGGSLGSALALWYNEMNNKRTVGEKDSMKCSYLGPEYSDEEVQEILTNIGANYKVYNRNDLIEETAEEIKRGKAIGWFQGRMEFGPRALGSRSIIGDPRSGDMQKNLNLKVKFRESFRPFAPSVLKEDVNEWFDLEIDSPYMLMVSRVKKNKLKNNHEEVKKAEGLKKLDIIKSDIPAVTHVDYTARVQTVKEDNGIYYDLIKKFKEKTGCPIIINTSFNVRGEPIVNTPMDAYKCFMSTNLDCLVIQNCFLRKEDQIKF